MNDGTPMVYVVDDEDSVRRSLQRLIRSFGFRVETFASARDFLVSSVEDGPSCLVLDVRMPGLSGLDLQKELKSARREIPIIFITAHGDVRMSVGAMKKGAVDFLQKPVNDADLLEAINVAIQKDSSARTLRKQRDGIRKRTESLTNREHQVLRLVVTGRLNKQIASDLGISEKTVKVHRRRVMQKMEAESLADLVRFTEKLGSLPPRTPSA